MQPSTVGDGTRIPPSTEALAGILEAVELLSSLYPLEDELVVPETLVNRLRELVDAGSPARDELEDQLILRLRLALDDEHTVEVEIAFPLRTDPANVIDLTPVETQQEDEQLPQRTPPPTVHLLQPAWLQNAAFERLESELGTDVSSTTDDEPTTIVLDYVQRLLDAAPAFLPAASVASTRSSFDGPASETAAIDLGELSLSDAMSKELLICVSKMHRPSLFVSLSGLSQGLILFAVDSLRLQIFAPCPNSKSSRALRLIMASLALPRPAGRASCSTRLRARSRLQGSSRPSEVSHSRQTSPFAFGN